MSEIKQWFEHTHQCPCGSGLVAFPCTDEKKRDTMACEKCQTRLLFKIFDEKFMDIFEAWLPRAMFDRVAPTGFDYQWQDLLAEKGCLRDKQSKNPDGHITLVCPDNPEIPEFYIHIPDEYARRVLREGTMV